MTPEKIKQTISEHSKRSEQNYRCLDLASYARLLTKTPEAKYGWTLPDEAAFCPELIADQISHLTEEEQLTYLHAVLWICDRHVFFRRRIPDREERLRFVETELYEVAPGSLSLLNNVQLRVLDALRSSD